MFGFFTKIKTELADVVAKVEALEAKIESYFADKAEPPKAEAPTAEDTTPKE